MRPDITNSGDQQCHYVKGTVDSLAEMGSYDVSRSVKYNTVTFHSEPRAILAIVRSPSPIPVVTHAYGNASVKSDVSFFTVRIRPVFLPRFLCSFLGLVFN